MADLIPFTEGATIFPALLIIDADGIRYWSATAFSRYPILHVFVNILTATPGFPSPTTETPGARGFGHKLAWKVPKLDLKIGSNEASAEEKICVVPEESNLFTLVIFGLEE